MKKIYIVIGIPFCLWTVMLALENESIQYMLLNVILAIPKAPQIFTDLLNPIMDISEQDREQSLQDAIEADRLASESELLNRTVIETTIVIPPEVESVHVEPLKSTDD
ncbi:hypothetical protein [Photobacterium sp. TY1-4]|uniref:hypothetical protein n=1 Tax=Photobacterium sp. TY1-4 TaxID=2899122 RepID=UPI0021C0E509|nr:hypothetical protein [Photobacterium sp. TY1-4]UXI04234.1 hypothetical protein NH461_19230 [Photobacterium sp. TY1-4]